MSKESKMNNVEKDSAAIEKTHGELSLNSR
jgi:hypothetical protein